MWRPKKVDRNITQRKKRKRWWKKNKNRLRHKRRRRRQLLQNNAMFKAWRKKRVKEKHRRRMRFASTQKWAYAENIGGDLPEVWFIFPEENELGQIIGTGMGFILDYDPDTEELLIFDTRDDQFKGVALDAFMQYAEPLEEADGANLELLLDQYYGDPIDDLDIIPEEDEAPPDMADEQVTPPEPVTPVPMELPPPEGMEDADIRIHDTLVERIAQRWLSAAVKSAL
jgi:hypothetical protein